MAISLYSLKNVRQEFGGRVVLDLAGLELAGGASYALLGPNGCGKTTLLHILALLVPPAGGELRFRGELVGWRERELRALRQRVVLVDQQPIMFSTTVRKNVEYGPARRGLAGRERRKLAAECLERVGMAEFAARPAPRLSGGETQRVAIARALACRPEVLLFDEPTASVDAANQLLIEKIIAELRRDRRITIIFATHRRREATRLADERIYLFNGKLTGPGGENLLTARIERQEGHLVCRLGEQLLVAAPAAMTPGEVQVLLDPAKVLVQPRRQPVAALSPGPVCPGRVLEMVAVGSRIKVVLDIGVLLEALLTREEVAAAGFLAGDQVEVSLCPGALQPAP